MNNIVWEWKFYVLLYDWPIYKCQAVKPKELLKKKKISAFNGDVNNSFER